MPYDIYNTQSSLNAINLKYLYQKFNGPVWVYEAEVIMNRIEQLKKFDVIRFAQKSCSNIYILRLIKRCGVKVDAVSLGEIDRALKAGFTITNDIDEILFTGDLFEDLVLSKIIKYKIPVNIGSIDMLKQLGNLSPGHRVWIRINPGFGHGHSHKTNTGGKNSKHGIWHEDLPKAIEHIHYYNLHLVGLHIHIGSGVDYQYLSKVCDLMVNYSFICKYDFTAISAGGGLPIPYYIHESSIDLEHYFSLWNHARCRISQYLGHPITLEIEPGRFISAESGVLISQVKSVKSINNRYFILVDVGFNDLVRPAMYGSYHHISLLPGDNRNIFKQPFKDTVVGGPVCESGDIFTQDIQGRVVTRKLPLAKIGDYIVFHDTGAYGASMSSNYNSRPFLPEVLFKKGEIWQIRRKQSLQELFSLEEEVKISI